MDLKDYRRRLKSEGLTDCTIRHYVNEGKMLITMLDEGGKCSDPRKIGVDDVMYLLDLFKDRDYSAKTRKGYFTSLKKMCNTYGNRGVPDWPRVRFPSDGRSNADWLSPDQVRLVLSVEVTNLERLIIHLGLCLGLRRIEAIRLRVHDINLDEATLRIRGKGAQGDKPRTIPFTVGTAQVIGDWMAERDQIINLCRRRRPTATIPDNLLIWEKAGRAYPYTEKGSGMNHLIRRVSKKTGVKFSSHTLRRTFGRSLYRAGVPVPTISKILGHDSIDITLHYLGVDLDDMREALSTFRMI